MQNTLRVRGKYSDLSRSLHLVRFIQLSRSLEYFEVKRKGGGFQEFDRHCSQLHYSTVSTCRKLLPGQELSSC